MPIKNAVFAVLNRLLAIVNAKIVRKSIHDFFYPDAADPPPLTRHAATFLSPDNPKLQELKARYRSLGNPAAKPSRWSEAYVKRIDLRNFRADGAFVWQRFPQSSAILTAYYVQKIDALGLLGSLREEGAFGAQVFKFNGELTLSRDLLDSVVEINFLESALRISGLPKVNILDIGAGYGRLAHRMVEALPNIGKYFCLDSVAEATFVSGYYLDFRGLGETASVVPLDEAEEVMAHNPINLAVNIHSFSECTLAAIEWWLDLLRLRSVRYLMVVPNAERDGGTQLLSKEADGRGLDFSSAIQQRGYKPILRQPKYLDPSVQTYGLSPTYYYLFELES